MTSPAPERDTGAGNAAFSRDMLLERGVAAIGDAWARHVVLCLHDRRRFASGAWAGTLSEARFRAAAMLGPWLWSRGHVKCQPVALSYAAFQINAAARRSWSEIRDSEATRVLSGQSWAAPS